jgi:hypothetical protein
VKYLIIFISSLIIEIASTFYISYVSERNFLGMVIFAAIGPFLSLPFAGFMVETKDWLVRVKMAFCLSLGYSTGAVLVYFFKF